MADGQSSVLVDFTAGVIGGCSGIVVGQPFDTVQADWNGA